MAQPRQAKKREPKTPAAVEQPLMATLLLDAQELGLLLQIYRQVNFPDPMSKHVAANTQMKAAQAAEVFPSLNGDSPE